MNACEYIFNPQDLCFMTDKPDSRFMYNIWQSFKKVKFEWNVFSSLSSISDPGYFTFLWFAISQQKILITKLVLLNNQTHWLTFNLDQNINSLN